MASSFKDYIFIPRSKFANIKTIFIYKSITYVFDGIQGNFIRYKVQDIKLKSKYQGIAGTDL